jgi:hypothetical protein
MNILMYTNQMYTLGYRFGAKLQTAQQNPEIWQMKPKWKRGKGAIRGSLAPRRVLC